MCSLRDFGSFLQQLNDNVTGNFAIGGSSVRLFLLKDQGAIEFLFEDLVRKSLGINYFEIKIFHETTAPFDLMKDTLQQEAFLSCATLNNVMCCATISDNWLHAKENFKSCDDLTRSILG